MFSQIQKEDFIKQMSKELKWASSKMCDTSKSQMPIEIYIVKVFLYFYNLNFILFSNEINTCTTQKLFFIHIFYFNIEKKNLQLTTVTPKYFLELNN